MRYRDAKHLDLAGFHARRPSLGAFMRHVGHGLTAVVPVLVLYRQTTALVALLAAAVGWWMLAWWLTVGGAWRTAAVGAILVAAVGLTLLRWGVV
jgi:hypothetical protein